MILNRTMLGISALLLGSALCGNAIAGPVWVCSITKVIQVDEDGTVGPPELGELAQPTFIRVDADAKQVTLLAPEARRGEVTKIDVVQQSQGKWLFSGVEEGRAWSMMISSAGPMTLSITGDGATWTVFGQALSQEQVQ